MYSAIVWLCAALAVGIFGVMLWSLATFAKAPGVGTAAYRRSPIVEVLWAIVPVVILFGAAAPSVRNMMQAEPLPLASTVRR